MVIEEDGIVLRLVPYKEKDAMVTILTKNGIKSFLARGIASPTSKNASSCLLFCYSNFLLNQKDNKLSLKQGKIIDSFYDLYSSLEGMSASQLAIEATLRFVDEDNTALFPYLLSLLNNLKQGFDSLTLLDIYLAKIIEESGYALEYKSCVKCGSKSNIVSLSFHEGGLLCNDCLKGNDIPPLDYLNSFRYCFLVEDNMMNHYALKKEYSYRLLNEFVNYLVSSFGTNNLKAFELYKNSI